MLADKIQVFSQLYQVSKTYASGRLDSYTKILSLSHTWVWVKQKIKSYIAKQTEVITLEPLGHVLISSLYLVLRVCDLTFM